MSEAIRQKMRQRMPPKPAEPVQADTPVEVAEKPKKFKRPSQHRSMLNNFEKKFQKRDRLPEGAEFKVSWDGKEWGGILTVPASKDHCWIFQSKAFGVFRLLANLDDLYRERLKLMEGIDAAAHQD